MTTQEILTRAKAAAAAPWLESAQKNEALLRMADALEQNQEEILSANRQDVEAARGTVSDVMLDRLALSAERIAGMAKGLREVAALPDPVGEVLSEIRRENGLLIRKVAVPMGVVAIIYESRPNVTSDAAALALKSGNVCILRSGKEALRSAKAIVKALQQGLGACGLDPALIQILEDPSRESARQLMQAEGYVDLLIPRGGAGLIRTCMEQASVPCIQTGTGICHVYVDASADFEMALNIIENAKTSRPSVCNAEEVLLVHEAAAERFLPLLQQRLCGKAAPHPVELRCDRRAAAILGLPEAGPTDFDTEFLDYILAVAVVPDTNGAIAHIAAHSTHHSEAIITEDAESALRFTRGVDSAAVYVNASTRFTDGGEFGLGCEMGISTQKLHARGPMGLRELTTYKYIITGNGQIRR
ncbi:MAG: glutamate-5-semialdehyde dehydrogenase [Clostridia bacterium]|nr:glutamate-5-semialdehyde dehydrogenase [Clostridia bacterium]